MIIRIWNNSFTNLFNFFLSPSLLMNNCAFVWTTLEKKLLNNLIPPSSNLWYPFHFLLKKNQRTERWNAYTTRRWHSATADPAKALGLSNILDRNPVVDINYLLFWEILLTNTQTDKHKNLPTQRFELSTLAFFSTMLLPTELWGRTHLITLIRFLLSDCYYPGLDWNPDPIRISG